METTILNNMEFVWDNGSKCFHLKAGILERTVMGFAMLDGQGKFVCAGSFDVLPGEAKYFILQLCARRLRAGTYTIYLTEEEVVKCRFPFNA